MINPWKVTTVILAGALATSIGVATMRNAQANVPQPHMYNAKNALATALSELNAAQDDKGGHRVIAIARATEALNQTQAGIDYANAHP